MNWKIEEETSEDKAPPPDWEIFGISGPIYLTSVNWRIPEHRRSVAASLVQGVYTLERDRQQKRAGHKALASIWWEFFHFQCIQILVDQDDSSLFGAIFEYKPLNSYYFNPPQNDVPPRYVIAFRGTIAKPDTLKYDLYLDIQLLLNELAQSTRYQTAFQAVESIVANVGPTSIWLAGHSLGAAIALQSGKDMAKRRCYIETYLFNPPFASAPIEKLHDPHLKSGIIRIVSSIATAGLSLLTKGSQHNNNNNNYSSQQCGLFSILNSWIPYLFVNPKDPICCEYVGYFEHREKMEAWGVGGIERIATENSIVSLLSSVFGGDSEVYYLIPSAFVIRNIVGGEQNLKLAHGIQQWWQPHPYWHCNLYKLR